MTDTLCLSLLQLGRRVTEIDAENRYGGWDAITGTKVSDAGRKHLKTRNHFGFLDLLEKAEVIPCFQMLSSGVTHFGSGDRVPAAIAVFGIDFCHAAPQLQQRQTEGVSH